MKPYLLQETNWKNLKSQKYEVAVIPWGATEPHNYHLPYGTDTLETEKMVEIAVGKAWNKNAKVMVLPSIPFGVQNPGQIELPFCLHVTPTTQMAIFSDLVKALFNQGINKIVIMNGHGGNDFKPIIREIQPDYPEVFLGLVEWFRFPEIEKLVDESGDHANEIETSIMQYLFPDLVLPLDEAGDGQAKKFKLKELNRNGLWTPRHWTKTTRDTGVGNPKKATPEKGEMIVEVITDIISEFLIELAKSDINDLYE